MNTKENDFASHKTRESRENILDVARALHHGFTWEETPQGVAYWDNVYENLLALAGPSL